MKMDVSSCDMCATNALASFHWKIKEAIALVRSMSTEDKLKAVQYWNVVSENLQDVVNSSADDISALQSQLCERENMILLQNGRGVPGGRQQPPVPRGFTIIQRMESDDGDGLELGHKQSRVTVIGPDIIDRYLSGQSAAAATCGEQLAVPVIVDGYDGLGACEALDDPVPEPLESHVDAAGDPLEALESENSEPVPSVMSPLPVPGPSPTSEQCDEPTAAVSPIEVPDELENSGEVVTDGTKKLSEDANYQKYLSFAKNRMGTVVLDFFTKHPKTLSPENGDHDYRCNVCQTLYPSLAAFCSHFVIYCEQLLCCKCGRTLPSRRLYRSHIVAHSSVLKCIECERTFTKFGNLSRHMKTHAGERRYECSVCQKRFVERKDLLTHSRLHSGERPYQCPQCPARFVQLGALTSHLRYHSGERPHLCDLCGKTFVQMTALKDHKLRHAGEKRFPCDRCPMAFNVRSDLKRHRRSHLPDKPHKCTQCSKSFPRAQALTEHLNRHFGNRPYQCQTCTKSYADRSAFNKHVKTHAPDELKAPRPTSPAADSLGAVPLADVDSGV